eukprot:PhF_6_TR13028/c1_g3_i5/m.20665
MRCNFFAEKNHALIVACTFGHTDVVQAILDNAPCTIKYVDKHGRTPLHIAAMHGHVCLIRLLLKHDATLVNVLDHESHDSVDSGASKHTALHMAAENDHCEVVRVLLELDPSLLRMQDVKGRTALHVAALNGCERTLRWM